LETVDHHFSELKKGKTLSTSKNILQIWKWNEEFSKTEKLKVFCTSRPIHITRNFKGGR
jgi:hypothetical protein